MLNHCKKKMPIFKYDVVTLIELVKSKPCLWDKTNENNKNKILRDKCWQEIFEFLEDDYHKLSQEERKKTGDIIMTKWCNLRDAFLRSLRKGSQGVKKCYKYGEHLQFLLKDQTEGDFTQAGTQDDSTEFDKFTQSNAYPQYPQCPLEPMLELHPAPSTSAEDLPKSKRQLDDVKNEILTELKRSKRSSEPCLGNGSYSYHSLSDQEILLLSFLPYIRDMDEAELMDFQMGVLSIVKKIKEQRV